MDENVRVQIVNENVRGQIVNKNVCGQIVNENARRQICMCALRSSWKPPETYEVIVCDVGLR